MKKIVFLLTLIPQLLIGQSLYVFVDSNAHLISSAKIIVDGNYESVGFTYNGDLLSTNGDVIIENSYSGNGYIEVLGNMASLAISDSVHNLIINSPTYVLIEGDISVRDQLELLTGKLNLQGGTLHLNNSIYAQNLSGDFTNSYAFNGKIRQNIAISDNYLIPLGSASEYQPINIDVVSAIYNNDWIEIELEEMQHINMPNSNDYLNQYWNINSSSFDQNTVFNIAAVYSESNFVGDELDLIPEVFIDPLWLGPTVDSDITEGIYMVDILNNEIQLYGISSIGDFTAFYRYQGCLGDTNNDGSVNILDLIAVSSNFGCSVNCAGDADGNGQVDILDLIIISSNFGLICP